MRSDILLNAETELKLREYLKGDQRNVILLGAKHMGKHMVAVEIAKNFLGLESETELSNHPDYHEVVPDEDVIGIEQVRKLMDYSQYRCLRAKKKCFVVDDADSMSEDAQNALLKVLEDGTGQCVFILVAHHPLIKTIASRCVSVEFYPVEIEEADEALNLLAGGRPGSMKLYEGSELLTYTASFLERVSNMTNRREWFELFGELKEKDTKAFFSVFSMEEIDGFLDMWERVFMNALREHIGMQGIRSGKLYANIRRLYQIPEICEIVTTISGHRARMRSNRYNKNDFFDLIITLGGCKYVV